jgi:hypothetical protein
MTLRRIRLAAAALALALTALVAPARPADAHNYNPHSTWYCAAYRPSGTNLAHSWPYLLQPGLVGYWCEAESTQSGASWQYWVHVNTSTGQSWRPWPYQSCKPEGTVWCGTSGH